MKTQSKQVKQVTKWITIDGYIEQDTDFMGNIVFRYVGEQAHEIMHALNKKERQLEEFVKPYADELRINAFNKVLPICKIESVLKQVKGE